MVRMLGGVGEEGGGGWRPSCILTRYGVGIAGRLAAGDEHDIPLARIRVFVLQEEEIVDAVVAKSGGLDHNTKRTSQLLLNHEVLLAANLRRRTARQSQRSSASRIAPMRDGAWRVSTEFIDLLPQGDGADPCAPCPGAAPCQTPHEEP